jgi:uncharacterized protein YkwD
MAHRALRLTTVTAIAVAGTVAVAPSATPATSTRTNASVTSRAAALAAPVIGIAATPTGKGYWRVATDGGVLTAGDARFFGSAANKPHSTVVAIASTPSGNGYMIVDAKGKVFAFGDAVWRGDMRNKALNKPVVGMALRRDGKGYWLVASDGGIFSFNAGFYGSMGGRHLNKPIVGLAARPDAKGYWMVASDGGIFSFRASFYGSMGGRPLNKPVVGMAPAPSGKGYTMVASDGGLFRFGDNVPFFGSAANSCPGAPAVGVAVSAGAVGYWITFSNAQTFAFSPSSNAPRCGPSTATKLGRMEADLFQRLNQERAARGLPGLAWDPLLASAAHTWSADMHNNGFRHSNLARLLGPYGYVGENIAAGSSNVPIGALHNAWMHSEGHRNDILAPGFTRVGVGAYCGPNGVFLTENFGRPSGSGSIPAAKNWPVDPVARPDAGTLAC